MRFLRLSLRILPDASFLLLFGLLLVTHPAAAVEESQTSRVYYDRGLHLDFPEAQSDLKLRLGFVFSYSYNDYDQKGSALRQDVSEFSQPVTRLIASGSVLGGKVSYLIDNDFAGSADAGGDGRRGNNLRGAYLQFNQDPAMRVRFGQFKPPVSLQSSADDFSLQFAKRSIATDFFNPTYQPGAGVLGVLDGGIDYQISIFNGQSSGEGQNRPAADNDHLGVVSLGMSLVGDYDRSVEGDQAYAEETALGLVLSGLYERGHQDSLASDYDLWGAGAGMGFRCHGFSAQTEFFYRDANYDEVRGAMDGYQRYAAYLQSGYFLVPREVELIGRVSWISLDEDFDAADDRYEYTVGAGHYFAGHDLKIQYDLTWESTSSSAGDVEDFRAVIQLTGVV